MQGVWQAQPDLSAWIALFGDRGPTTWQVRVKPQGALSHTFTEVLVPGGDPLDPYLRMRLTSGDVNNDDCIDDANLLALLFAFGQTGNRPEHLNRDGVVEDADLLLDFGAGCE